MTAVLEKVQSENADIKEFNGLTSDEPVKYQPAAFTREGDGD